MYKILVVDDSALMRRIICDIINADSDFRVIDVSADGEDAYNKILNNTYDLIVLDMILPKLPGVDLLERLYKEKVACNVVIISSSLREDADSTMKAMEYGALDFVVKPIRSSGETREIFASQLIESLHNVSKSRAFKTITPKVKSVSRAPEGDRKSASEHMQELRRRMSEAKSNASPKQADANQTTAVAPQTKPVQEKLSPVKGTSSPVVRGKKIIALACSTGGPQALHTVIPMLPKNLPVPLILVQHMPEGFTASLASRLDQISQIKVKEAEDGEVFQPGVVYITPGGKHMKIREDASHSVCCVLDDSPPVNSLKPCADVMYRALAQSSYEEIVCVVLTGMGADGSEGIKYLNQYKKTYVISQEASTCVVYGMPKAVELGGLSDEVVPLKSVANSIVKKVGG